MSITRSTILGGPAYATFNSKTIQFAGDLDASFEQLWDDVTTALYGKVDQTNKDALVKVTGTPLYYDTAQIATLFPYINGSIGKLYPVSGDLPLVLASNNGDTVTVTSALVTKMPDLILGVTGAIVGPMEFTGIIANGADPSGSSSEYFTQNTAQSYANPAVPGTAVLGRQEFTAAWGSISGFTSFQAQDRWTISHELSLEPVAIQDRTRAYRLLSYRCMAKCMPIGPTMAQINAALTMQNTGAAGGALLSAYTEALNSASAANLVITGSSSMTVTLSNAGLMRAGFKFGGKPLRQGELGWVSTLLTAGGGAPTAALQLS